MPFGPFCCCCDICQNNQVAFVSALHSALGAPANCLPALKKKKKKFKKVPQGEFTAASPDTRNATASGMKLSPMWMLNLHTVSVFTPPAPTHTHAHLVLYAVCGLSALPVLLSSSSARFLSRASDMFAVVVCTLIFHRLSAAAPAPWFTGCVSAGSAGLRAPEGARDLDPVACSVRCLDEG